MTTAESASAALPPARTVAVAGVPWPAHKVLALLVGAVVFGLILVMASAAAPAVLAGAGATTLVWAGVPLVASLTH